MHPITILLALVCLAVPSVGKLAAQTVACSPEEVIALTPEWKGERLPDGRALLPDVLLERLKNVALEEVWGILRQKGYNNQFEGD